MARAIARFTRRGVAARVLLAALFAALPNAIQAEKCTTGFSVVAPEAAVPGKTTAVLVTLHQELYEAKRLVNVTLRLEAQRDSDGNESTIIAVTSKTIYGHGIIPLKVPMSPPGAHTLHALVTCPHLTASSSSKECEVLRSHSLLRLVGPVRDVIVRPDKQTYFPGETVTFWILALDHDLKLPKNVLGTVSLKDPAGTKVAIWDQISLDEGVKKFSIDLSDHATGGSWAVHVSCGGGTWSGALNVSGQQNSGGGGIGFGVSGGRPPAAEEHYVELRFGPGTRRRYKPGLPFVGKVEAVSTEKSVRVRVKVYDNTTSIYSQDIEISQGEGTFTVPAMLADSDVIHLQAELVSVEGKEIESHYILAQEPIQKWNSSSECYILIEGMDKPFQAGSRAHATVVSTCPCDRDTHIAAVTDGQVTLWAERRAPTQPLKGVPSKAPAAIISWGGIQPGIDGAALCRFNYSFTVKSDMAPSSQLLVYYVTPDGEPVSDVAEFEVQLLHKQVSVSVEAQGQKTPGDPVEVKIAAEPGSLVCLIGGSTTTDKFDPWTSHSHHRTGAQHEEDFLEAGVSLFQRRCGSTTSKGSGFGTNQGSVARSSVTYRKTTPAGMRRRRPPLLPQPADRIWMWDCFNITSDVSRRQVVIPDSIFSSSVVGASIWAASVGSGGLRAGAVQQLPRPERALRAALANPPPLTVGETLELDVGIANDLDSCMDVTALLSLSGGAQFVSNGMMYVTERLRLGPRGATSLVVRILVTKPGLNNLTAEISGYKATGCTTGPPSPGLAEPEAAQGDAAGKVVRTALLKVRSEGLRRTDTESAYFCANEHTLISTKEKYKYEWISAPRNRAALVFEVRAGHTVRVALSDERGVTDQMYHVTFGDADNSLTWIGRGSHGYGVHLSSAPTPDTLSGGSFRTFWVSWERGSLSAGRGAVPASDALAKWRLDAAHRVRHVGFSTAWGQQAEFRVWNFNDEAGFSQVVQLSLPRWAVPGSAAGELLVAGGLALPWAGLGFDASAISPSSLAAATAVLAPLLSLQKENATKHEETLRNVPGQIQKLLSFRKNDNSFSDHQSMSSHLATVHVLEVLTKTQAYFGIDPELLQSIKRWVQLRQEDDGSFTPLPADVKISLLTTEADLETNSIKRGPVNAYEELDYGIVEKWKNLSKEVLELERNVEVTAETLATLLEIGMENELDSDTILKAKTYLEANLHTVTSSHPLASLVYALVLSQSPMVPEALEKLRNASTTEEGDFGWPHPLPRRDADWLYEEDSTRRVNPPLLTSLEDFRASLCCLLVYTELGDLRSAEPVARYLFYRSHLLDRHTELLYQAIKAFSGFSTLAYDRHRSLTVSLATAGMELTDTVELKANHPARHLHLPSLPTKVFVYATGAGCATVQGRITYSTYTPSADNALLTLWSAVIEEIRPERSSLEELQGKLPTLNVKTCFRWKSQDRSGVLRLEVTLFSGYELVSVSPVVVDGGTFADLQHGFKDNFIWFAFANISSSCPVCINYQARSTFVLSSLRPAFASIYPATRPDLAAEVFFHTKPGSLLLKGITEDDLITWFGKTDSGIPNVGQDLPNICECGKICHNRAREIIDTTINPIENESINIDTNDNEEVVGVKNQTSDESEIFTTNSSNAPKDVPIIVPSLVIVNDSYEINQIKNNSSVVQKVNRSGDEIVIQQKVVGIKKSNIAKMLYDLDKKQPYQKKQPTTRKKGTLKHTYGDNHTMFNKPNKIMLNSFYVSSSTVLPIITTLKEVKVSQMYSITEGTVKSSTTNSLSDVSLSTTTEHPIGDVIILEEKDVDVKSEIASSILEKSTVASIESTEEILTMSSGIISERETNMHSIFDTVTINSNNNIKIVNSTNNGSIPTISTPPTTPYQPPPMPKSINREKHHIPSVPISETTLELVSESPPAKFLPVKNDQLLVVDRNALWGLLKEVVQIEMDKNQEKIEAESNRADKSEERIL